MSTYAALAHACYVDSYDLTSDLGTMVLQISKDPLDTSTFGPTRTARSRIAGLEDVQGGGSGPWQAGSGLVDPQMFTNLGSLKVVTQVPEQTDGVRSYFYQSRDFMYRPFGNNVGDLTTFEWACQSTKGSGTLSAGAIAGYLGKAKGDVSATGALGTFKQLGAVGATQYLYANLHVFSVGTTITVVLESDDNSSFSSATTRATIGPLTAVGGTWATRVAGAITDDYYRFRVTAITGTFNVAGSFGIK